MRYTRHAVFIAIFIAVAIELAGGGGLRLSGESEASSDSYPSGITTLSASGLAQKVIDSSSKPTFLFIYASWCPYCKKQFPDVEKLAETYHNKVNFLTLSIDKAPQALADFLGGRAGNETYGTFFYDARESRLLMEKLRQMGAQWSGGIPFMVVFDGKGKPLAQFGGLTPPEILRKELDKAL